VRNRTCAPSGTLVISELVDLRLREQRQSDTGCQINSLPGQVADLTLCIAAAGSIGQYRAFWLGQFPYRALDRRVHPLSVALGISHYGVPMQAHVRRPVASLQDQRLLTPLLAERVIRRVAKKIVHACFPDSALDCVDDRSHSTVKFPRNFD